MNTSEQPYPVLKSMDAEDAKEVLRKAVLARRRQRSERRRMQAAEALADVLDTFPGLRDATCVAAYAARPTEPGTLIFLDRLRERGVRVLLPVLGVGLRRDWATYAGRDDLSERAPVRPPEPSTANLGPDALKQAQAIIAPALAVDSSGTRLGHGGGWYDRALDQVDPGLPVIALVYRDEIYDAETQPLPAEPHDRKVRAVATPEGWRWLDGTAPTGWQRPRRAMKG